MNETTKVTSTHFQQNVGEVCDMARKGPILVTRHNRPQVVVLDPDEYERLKQYDTRRALHPSVLDDDIKAALQDGYQGVETPDLDHLMD